MKKHLIAAAVAAAVAAPAMAQNVTLSGILKPGVDVTKRTDQNGQTEVADQSSRFIMNGSEDLGGGMKAIFQIDTRLGIDNTTGGQAYANNRTATEIGNGNTWVGITGSLGELRLGKHDLHYNEMGVLIDGATNAAGNLQSSAAGGLMSQVTGNGAAARVIAGATRTPNLIKYDSPDFSGFRFGGAYSSSVGTSANAATDTRDGSGGASNAAKTNGGSAFNLTARYGMGPLTVVGSYWTAKSEDRTVVGDYDQKSYMVGGRYTLGATRVSAVFNDSKATLINSAPNTRGQRTGYAVAVDHDLSASTVLHFTYAAVGNLEEDNVTRANTGADHVTVGATYSLSKRTSTGVYYTRLDNKNQARYNLFQSNLGAVANGDTLTSFYLGLRHAF